MATYPAFLGARLSTLLGPGEAVHLSLVANAAALAQGDRGLVLEIRPRVPLSGLELRVVPDDPMLGALLVESSTGPRFEASGAVVLWEPSVALRCGRVETCEVGVTVELLSAAAPTILDLRMGLEREQRAWPHSSASAFDADASVGVVFD